MVDPYVYPGTTVLINKADIRDREQLKQMERIVTQKRREQLRADTNASIAKDTASYLKIHQYLFQDVYEWAGKIRVTELSKGNSFFAVQSFVESSLDKELRTLQKWDFKNISVDQFVERSAHHISELNAIHPFREGNGRTMRVHLERLARAAHLEFDLTKFPPHMWNEASIASFQGNMNLMQEVMAMGVGVNERVVMQKNASEPIITEQYYRDNMSQKSVYIYKEQFVGRLFGIMEQKPELAALSSAERLSLAATVALAEAKENSDVVAAKKQLYTGILLVIDAQDKVQSETEQRNVASDIERVRDAVKELSLLNQSNDIRYIAARYVPSLDSMVEESMQRKKTIDAYKELER
ncbi:MAG: hypothetical protein EAZ74_03645 [Alphaproteobacteria bacterium]|nr:MAG: hypothetical protein EAY76_06435 [Alphaproteobacteria bacterium]TAF14581.1 MAG: hypothetical protein EAZ74_03645 [Alphaproteobacteria bacterium]TAF38875.1 MAG: hypothetical protein EAZ66_05775 [Alphaproteobacteria bacterium]TAF74817.1 MAG: hypothetical protein EAZ52_08120 [Alphaproteobacteria bacterium]